MNLPMKPSSGRSLFDFDDIFNYWPFGRGIEAANGAFSPRCDIKDMKDHYEITAELPGVDKKDLEVTLDNGVLTITAETRKEEKEEKEGKVIRQERRYGKYMRSFLVGDSVKEADIKADFKDGVLKLTAPKVAPVTPEARRIKVS